MKKLTAVFVATVLCIASVFALDMSAGANLNFTPFGHFTKKSTLGIETKGVRQAFMMGFKGFFDLQYATITAGVNGTVGKKKSKVTVNGTTLHEGKTDLAVTYLNFGLMGKYPFALGSTQLYPLIGFDFDIPLAGKSEGYKIDSDELKENYHMYWFDIGFGADIFVTKALFIRPSAIFGLQMNTSKYIKDMKPDSKLGYKVDISIGVGYKF